MNARPTLAKTMWTEADFDQMSWHDNEVHAFAIEPALPEPGRLLLDIDYIVQWVPPQPPSSLLSFWICPATLVFDPAWDLTTDIDLRGVGLLAVPAFRAAVRSRRERQLRLDPRR